MFCNTKKKKKVLGNKKESAYTCTSAIHFLEVYYDCSKNLATKVIFLTGTVARKQKSNELISVSKNLQPASDYTRCW